MGLPESSKVLEVFLNRAHRHSVQSYNVVLSFLQLAEIADACVLLDDKALFVIGLRTWIVTTLFTVT